MKRRLLLLLFTGVIFTACSNLGNLIDREKSNSYFLAKNGQISFCQDGNWFELGAVPMQADLGSFKVLSRQIAKDKNTVFFRGYPQKEVDVHSFYLDHDVPKDKRYVYVAGDGKMTRILGADAASFTYLRDFPNWAKDNKNYFFNYKAVPVDVRSFQLINKTFSRDRDSVYMAAESGKFTAFAPNMGDTKSINDWYMQNGNRIFYLPRHPKATLLMNSFASIDTIRLVNKDIICVNNSVITYGKKILYPGLDVASFQLFPSDNGHFVSDLYSKDSRHVFYDGVLIGSADPNTYEPLGFGFGKDNRHAYYRTDLLKGVDSKSFKESDGKQAGGIVFGDKLGNKFDYWTGKKIN